MAIRNAHHEAISNSTPFMMANMVAAIEEHMASIVYERLRYSILKVLACTNRRR